VYRLLDPSGADILDLLPVIEVRPIDEDTPLRVKFALRDSPTVNAGFVLQGSLWIKWTPDVPIEQIAVLDVDISTAGIFIKGELTADIPLPPFILTNAEMDLAATFVPPDVRFYAAADLASAFYTTRLEIQIPFELDEQAVLLATLRALDEVEQLWIQVVRPLMETDPIAAFNGENVALLFESAGLETPEWIAEIMRFIDALPVIEGVPVNSVMLFDAALGGLSVNIPPGAGYPAGGVGAEGCPITAPILHTDGRCYTITPFGGNEMGFRTITECPVFQVLENGQCWTTPPSVTSSVPMQMVCPVGSTLEGGRCWVLERTPNNLAYAERAKVYSCDLLWERVGTNCVWRDIWGTIVDSKPAYYGCPALSAEFEGKCYTSPVPGTPTLSRNLAGAVISPSLGCWEIGHVPDHGANVCWTILGPPTLASNPNPTVRQECSHLVSGIPVFGEVKDGKCYYLFEAPRAGTPLGGFDQVCQIWVPFYQDEKCWTIPPTDAVQLLNIPGLCHELNIPCTTAGVIEEAVITPVITELRSLLEPYVHSGANLPPVVVVGGPYSVPEGGSVSVSAAGSHDPEDEPITIEWDLTNNGSFADAIGETATFSAASITGPDQRLVAVRATDPAGNSTTERFWVTVEAVAPTLTATGPATVDATAEYTLTLGATDPGGTQTLRWRVDWGDGSSESTLLTANGTLSHVYSGAVLNPVITISATDKDGTYNATPISVTVIQVDPEVTLTAPGTADEGSLVEIEGTLFEPGGDDALALRVDWGDGTVVESTAAAGVESYTASHRYVDDGTYTITVRATNPYGAFDEASSTITVMNVAPTLELLSIEGDEGSTVVLQGAISDPGILDTFEVVIEWGDGETSNFALGAGATALVAEHIYADDALYTVSVNVTDKDGGSVTESTTADIANVAPTLVEASVTPSPSNEGDEVTFTATLVEPGADVVTIVVDWGDGSTSTETYQPGETEVVFTHVYQDNSPEAEGQYRLTVTATDDDGGSTEQSEDHRVRNVAPADIVLGLSAAVIDEGDEVTLSGSFFDPGVLDTFTVVIDWGDGSEVTELSLAAGVQEFEATHAYVDDDPTGVSGTTYTLSVTVTDKDGGVGEAAIDIDVLNVAPHDVSLSLDHSVIDENDSVVLSGTFVDPGLADTFTVAIDWGDGSSPTVLELLDGEREFEATHQYLDDDPTGVSGTVYTISVTVTDDDTDSGSASIDVAVENVAPTILSVTHLDRIDENDVLDLSVTFSDPGTLDTFVVSVDWGDGSEPTVIHLDDGEREFELSHRYLDDAPSGTSEDTYTITIVITDDDTDSVFGPRKSRW
jgi:hypothetical protein